ncbi:TlyA family RNA methyltransferase [Alkaliphilus pronyensis]|uniref:TlyA family RNA methyltransferase n=1 Tax=Alkaliphilus pronyensis TaxID=1482732 RepID=A0A6I0F3A5_9FIRM|nr:TlyA family RNA methyltransferase [Alkaliphilus pronyensis]KAB3537391.1 TlyA family RNA methyltransferase [Alkaliphilus pronyensis]
MSEKMRLDQFLFQEGYFDSREKARRSIMAGVVFVDNQKIDKPGTKISIASNIYIKENPIPYVSRGGLKLEKALKEFNITLNDNVCIDIGASTGGFTDCMLKNGAIKVFSIDVGYGQLDWRLRQDPRVTCMERTNIRYVEASMLDGIKPDFASIDVSFISLKLVLPVVKNLLKENAEIVALIKPQFEAGKEKVGKKGVVRDIEVHKEVVKNIVDFTQDIGLSVLGLSFSPIKGPEGNIEYLLYIKNTYNIDLCFSKDKINSIIEKSHRDL